MKLEAEGSSPAIVSDHPFEPRLEPVGVEGKDAATGWVYVELPPNEYLCKHCALAEAAHVQ